MSHETTYFGAAFAVALLALNQLALPASAAAQYAGTATNAAYVAAFDTAIGPAGSAAPRIHGFEHSRRYYRRKGGHVQIEIGGVISFQGTIDADETISGTADYQGRR